MNKESGISQLIDKKNTKIIKNKYIFFSYPVPSPVLSYVNMFIAWELRIDKTNKETYTSIQNRFYNRETIAALNYEMHQKSFITPFPSMQLK